MKGRFRIQSVAEMTGVPASTLRAWEQRYGFPAPERTASAYRVYSQDDIDLIAAVRARCDAGMAPAEAVAEVLESATKASAPPPSRRKTKPAPARSGPVAAGVSPLVDRIVQAAHAPDPAALDEAVRSALMLGSPVSAYESALGPAWSALRRDWSDGRLGTGSARIALEILGHAARDLIRLGQPGGATDVALLTAMPDEDDIVPLVPVALHAQSEGHRAVVLAPRASSWSIGQAATDLDAQRVAIATSETIAPRRAREIFDDIASRVGARPWVVCGPGSEALRDVVQACGGEVF